MGGETIAPVLKRELNHAHPNFNSNTVSSSRYTFFNFIPLVLFSQFRRLVNVYFLVISILQLSTSSYSPTNPYSTIVPLATVLFIAALREAIDDFRRHVADGAVNNAQVCRLQRLRGKPVEWKEAKCKDLTSGDLVLLVAEDVVPADLILLSTSAPSGAVFVDTSSLDGEPSLKLRAACKSTREIRISAESIAKVVETDGGLEVECEEQTSDINYIKGTLTTNVSGSVNATQFSRVNVMLRGEILRNTQWCLGMVLFTGGKTKMALNSRRPKKKRSRLDLLIDWLMLVVLIVLLLLCTVSAVASRLWAVDNATLYFYLPFLTTSQTSVREIWLTSLILLNGLLPISLYVQMELAQLLQAYSIENDETMFFKKEEEEDVEKKALQENDRKQALGTLSLSSAYANSAQIVYKPEAHSSSLNSTLGMVGVVVTDKTGTLTQNKMKLRTILTAGETFSSNEKSFINKQLSDILNDESDPSHKEVQLTLLTLALCHNVQVSNSTSDGKKQDYPVKLQCEGASPDEVALVHAASLLGFELVARDGESITLRERGKSDPQRYELLAVNEFDHTRKRMSVLVRCPDGHAFLLVKGADSAIVPKVSNAAPTVGLATTGRRSSIGGGDSNVAPDSAHTARSSSKGRRRSSLVRTYNVIAGAIQASGGHLPAPETMSFPSLSSEESTQSIGTPAKPPMQSPRGAANKESSSSRKPLRQDEFSRLRSLQLALDSFATEGLRTLVLAYRECSEADVARLLELRDAAKGSSAVLLAANEMESNLSLAGATGVEDMLQEGVPETMRMLSRASIRVVMCTGDKTETAIATALSSCMLPPDCDLVLLKSKDRATNISSLSAARTSLIERGLWRPGTVNQALALVIEGHTLDDLLVFDDNDRTSPPSSKEQKTLGGQNKLWHNYGALHSLTTWLNRASRSMANLFGENDGDVDNTQDNSSRGLTFFMIKARRSIVTAKTARKAAEAAAALEKNVSPVEARERLVEFMLQCRAVVCSRMTPSQKADIVRLLQRSSKRQEDVLGNVQSAATRHIVLAIGDGANDVRMNQTADVSVGISGSNGRQALLASDYVVGQFRFLAPLMFVHGRTNYRRLALLSCYCVYKNIVLGLVLWGFTFYTGFSGTALFESFLGSLWSVVFTSLPIIAVAIFDEDVPASFALSHPEIYASGQHDSHFSTSVITAWLASSALHAFIIGVTGANNLLGVSGGSLGGDGLDGGFILDGTALHAVLVATVMGKLALHTYKWTVLTSFSFVLSGAFWLAFVYAYSAIDLTDNSSFHGVASQLMQRYSFGFVLLLVPITALLTDFVILHLLRVFFPTLTSIVQEIAALSSASDVVLSSSSDPPYNTPLATASHPLSPTVQHHDVISVNNAPGALETDLHVRVQSIVLGSPLPQDNAQKALTANGVSTIYASESSSSSSSTSGVAVTRVGVKGLVIDSDMVIAASAVHDAAFAEAEDGSEQKMAEDDHEFLVITLQRLTRQIRAELKRKERRILQRVALKSPGEASNQSRTSSEPDIPRRRRISLTIRTLIGSSSSSSAASSSAAVPRYETGALETIASSNNSGEDEEAAVMAAALSAPNVNTRRGGATLTPIKINDDGIAAPPLDGASMSPKTTPMAALRQLSRSISTRFSSSTATEAIDEISAGANQVQTDDDFGDEDDDDNLSDADSLGSTARDDDFGELEGARSFGQLHNIGSTISLAPGQLGLSRTSEILSDAPTFSRFTHSFADPIRERAFFRHFFVRKSTRLTRVSICMAIFFAAAYLFIDLSSSSFAQILVRSLILGGGIILLFLSCLDVFKEPGFYSGIMLSVVIVAGIAKTLIIDAEGLYGQTLFQMGIMLVLRLRFSHALAAGVIDLTIFIIFKSFTMPEDKALALLPSFFVYVVFCMVFVAISSLKLHAAMREDYLSESKLTLEERKGREMVSAMLPPHVVAALQGKQAQAKNAQGHKESKLKKQLSLIDFNSDIQGASSGAGALAAELNFSEHEPSVTIVFIDIQDFKTLTAAMTPPLLVALLDRLWALLDALAEKYGITKLETVGKEYVACAGLNGSRSDHATACVAFAVNALRLLQLLRTSDGRQAVQVRIGINSGPVVAGIVGHVRPQFVLVGNTTNVSSRMSSTGLDNCVNMSQSTYDRVRHKYQCISRTINVKGKGVMTSYYVVGAADASVGKSKSFLIDAEGTSLSSQPQAVESLALTAESSAASLPPSSEGFAEEQSSKSSDILLNRILERKKDERERMAERLRRRAQTVALHPITYAFKSSSLEDRWARSQLSASLPGIRRATILFAIYNLFRLADDLLLYNVARVRTSLIRRPTDFEISARLIMSVLLVLFFILTYSQWYLSFEFPLPGSKRLLCIDHIKKFTRLHLHEFLIAFSGILFVVSSVTPDEATLDLLLFFCVSSNSQAQSYISATTVNVSVFALFVLLGEATNVFSEAVSGEKIAFDRSLYYFLIVGLVMCAFSQAAVEFYRRHRFAVSLLFSTEVGRNQELLYRMLPSAVVAQLLTGGGEHAAHEFSGVCILVCDVVSFTKLSSESSPVEVIAMLNGMFAGFERAAAKYKVFKVQTIGDAFVCVAGIPYVDGDADIVKKLEPAEVNPPLVTSRTSKDSDSSVDHLRTPQKSSTTNSVVSPLSSRENVSTLTAATSVAKIHPTMSRESENDKSMSENLTLPVSMVSPNNQGSPATIPLLDWECLSPEAEAILPRNQLFAARMLRTAVEFVQISRTTFHPRTGEPINIRVGMHSGTVVGGVIGTRAFRFDVWGPDVLRANKYESGGVSGGINVSLETHELLRSLQKHPRFFIPGLSFRAHMTDDVPAFIVSIEGATLAQGIEE